MNYIHPPSASRLAARAVALHGPGSPADRKELLAVLGLLDADGVLQELPQIVISPHQIERTTETQVGPRPEPRWDRSNVPPGLRDLPPPPKVTRKATPRPKRPPVEPRGCRDMRGTITGRSRHRREGSKVCDECRQAYNAWQRANDAAKGRTRPNSRNRRQEDAA